MVFALLGIVATPILIAQIASAPSPAAAPLKTIIRVRSSALCSALQNNLFPAVAGLRSNDELFAKGQQMMQKTHDDSAVPAPSFEENGGGTNGTEMDDFQMGELVTMLGRNLVRVENLLGDPRVFVDVPATDDERALAQVKERLEAVIAAQRAALNVLSSIATSNDANDLRSRRDIIPYEHDMSGPQTPPFTAASAPEALAGERMRTQQSETHIPPVVDPIVAACR